jgi:hypothetical protein
MLKSIARRLKVSTRTFSLLIKKLNGRLILEFCTPWPKELVNDDVIKKYFPIEVTTSDYIYAGPSIRDERSRIVELKVNLMILNERNLIKFYFIDSD